MEFLIALSVLGWVVSLFFLNEATAAVASMAFACWCAILARMIQSSWQHTAVMEHLRNLPDAAPSEPKAHD